MTRKDFELIAQAIKEWADQAIDHYLDERGREVVVLERHILANRLARDLATTNTAFDRERFLKAAGVT